jgi:hypothetical protein
MVSTAGKTVARIGVTAGTTVATGVEPTAGAPWSSTLATEPRSGVGGASSRSLCPAGTHDRSDGCPIHHRAWAASEVGEVAE